MSWKAWWWLNAAILLGLVVGIVTHSFTFAALAGAIAGYHIGKREVLGQWQTK